MGYGNKGRKKRSPKSGDSSLQAAPSRDGQGAVPAAEDSYGSLQQEQVKPKAPIVCSAEKTSRLNAEAAPFVESKNKASLDGESSSYHRPTKSFSVPCRFFQRGYCRYGHFCRFQHLEAPSAPAEPFNSAAKGPFNMRAKAAPEKSCTPQECLDWHLTGSCPRYRTCRYAHPINHGVGPSRKNMSTGMHVDSEMAQLLRHGLGGSRGRGDDKMSQRMRNGGFTDDDVYELSLQGIKPWDPEAWDALAVLNGMDGGYGFDDYDYDDDDYDELGRRMSGFDFY